MIPVKVDRLFLSNMGYVVLLKGESESRSLPIFIGEAEAQAIAMRMNNVELPRPMTHDLLKSVLDMMECRLQRVEVSDLVDGTFFARLIVERDGSESALDSRPSDGIALALRCGTPIFVAEKVMDEAGRVFPEEEKEKTTKAAESPKEDAKPRLSPVEVLQRRLAGLIERERYEEAAKVRDEIQRLQNRPAHN